VAHLAIPAGLSDARLEELVALGALGTADAAAQLTLVADDLVATLAEQLTQDGRNVAGRALRRRLAYIRGLLVRCRAGLETLKRRFLPAA
jgi:hypothetical protein